MHPFSILTLGIFVAGYITARWDLVTRLYELAIFAWDHEVLVRGHQTLSSLIEHLLKAPFLSDKDSQGFCNLVSLLLRLHHPNRTPSCP